jgi:hypothetical protein
MAKVITRQSTENMEYVRNLLKHNQPAFSMALELARGPAGTGAASTRGGGRPRRFPGLRGTNPGSVAIALCPGQARGSFTSSGTDSALIVAREVNSGDVIPFRVQSVATRSRFPDMAARW